jgi:predicted AlkP superfamily phosphohydrolase/phosphomutase
MSDHPKLLSKLLILGLDGATYSVLDPLIEAGYMPNLQRLLATSARMPLLSTIPPITALAWPTVMTGNNPGKHGLLGWQEPLNEAFERPWANARKVHGAKIWHYLNAMGYRVCVANVPVTYPPESLDGTMVTGMLTPSLNTDFTYPRALKKELLAEIPEYAIDIDVRRTHRHRYGHKKQVEFLTEAQNITRIRGRSFRWLLAREKPEAAFFVFELPDRLQHLHWRQIAFLPEAENDSPEAAAMRDALLENYRVLDEEVGKLLHGLDESTPVVVLSDHGFGPTDTNIHLNDWLAQHGWLQFQKYRAGGWNVLRQVGRRFKRWIPDSLITRTKSSLPLYKTIDWSKTVAYAGSPSEYGIFLNRAGREPAGIVAEDDNETVRDQIIEALKLWRHPDDQRPVMKAVYKREDVYTGPYASLAPDIIFELERGFYISDITAPSPGELFSDVSHETWGFHEREGIFAMKGPGILAGDLNGVAHLAQILPTILYALDFPLPEDIDGRPLTNIFDPEWLSSHPIKVGLTVDPAAHFAGDDDSGYSESEEELVAERLRNLGYFND